MVLGGGNTILQRLWVSPVMVAMAVLWWLVVGFVVVVGFWVRWLLAVGFCYTSGGGGEWMW